ncbi:MAG: hypothetical protein WC849_01255 [Candidatus Paceibacterota bacterium]
MNQKIKILITTGIYPPKVGGPSQYAKELEEEYKRKEHTVKVITYKIEHKLPIVIRHIAFFFKAVFNLFGKNFIISLDTFSTGFPTILACILFRKKNVIRIGGDFLWESYVERTGHMIPLNIFYFGHKKFSIKEKIIYFLTKFVLNNSGSLAFNTKWQKDIFVRDYKLSDKKNIYVIENFIGEKEKSEKYKEKNFLWFVRDIKLKNGDLLKKAFSEAKEKNEEIILETGNLSHEKLFEKIKSCYVVILPSLSDIGPNYILDAIRFNKPFILTKYSDYYEKFKNIGIFVDPLDKGDIKNKILYLADEKNYLKQQEKIKQYNSSHTWSEIAEEFLNIYKKL